MPHAGQKATPRGKKKMNLFTRAITQGGSQLENPKGSRGPKTMRISTGAMRNKMSKGGGEY